MGGSSASSRCRQPGRRAAGADRDQYGRAIDDRGHREITERRSIDRIDEETARAQPERGRLGLGLVLQRDDREPRGRRLLPDDDRARALQQAALGIGSVALADQDHGLPGDADEDRQAVHEEPLRAWRGACQAGGWRYVGIMRAIACLLLALLALTAARPGCAAVEGRASVTTAPAARGAHADCPRVDRRDAHHACATTSCLGCAIAFARGDLAVPAALARRAPLAIAPIVPLDDRRPLTATPPPRPLA